jgi:hypothetical protein
MPRLGDFFVGGGVAGVDDDEMIVVDFFDRHSDGGVDQLLVGVGGGVGLENEAVIAVGPDPGGVPRAGDLVLAADGGGELELERISGVEGEVLGGAGGVDVLPFAEKAWLDAGPGAHDEEEPKNAQQENAIEGQAKEAAQEEALGAEFGDGSQSDGGGDETAEEKEDVDAADDDGR